MVDKPIHIVFAGGGTAGHLFPGIAVAQQIRSLISTARITFAGTGKDFERKFVHRAGFDYLALRCRPMSYRPKEAIRFVVQNTAGWIAAKRFVSECSVNAVVGLGGYASVPMGLAAKSQKLPLVLLEQNAVPGKATRWLARWADVVCTSFAQTKSQIRTSGVVRLTGNPIRAEFDSVAKKFAVKPHKNDAAFCDFTDQTKPKSVTGKKSLVILGGSAGSGQLNDVVPKALQAVKSKLGDWDIVHQSGEEGVGTTRQIYRKLGVAVRVVPFIDNMPKTLSNAGFTISRAGGTTLAELATAGVPSLLIPYPHATDDHQRKNADHFATGGGCLVLDDRELDGQLSDVLSRAIDTLLTSSEKRRHMSLAIQRQAFPNSATEVATIVEERVKSRRRQLTEAA